MTNTRIVIIEAFASVPKPNEIAAITPHQCPECDEFAAHLMAYTYENLPAEIIEDHSADLPLLGPLALQHYLPAYMLYSLGHPKSNVMMFTIFHLTPSEGQDEERKNYFQERFGPFTQPQSTAIALFLDDVRNSPLQQEYWEELKRAALLWPTGT